MKFDKLSIKKAHQGLINQDFSAQELTEYYLKKIEEKNKSLNAFLQLNKDLALDQAKKVDNKISQGEDLSALAGLPMAMKDNILVKGLPATAGSKILENYRAVYDATVAKKLKNNNFIHLGRTNLDEFAMGSSCENSAFGPTKNPLDLTRVPGGSSGGSAAAVAADMALYALGSDTGGSVRQPAAFCGLVGLKPTYGRVSRYGLFSLTSSTDVIGSLTRSVPDAAFVLEGIAGFDKKDSTSANKKVENYSKDIDKHPGRLKIGLPKEYFGDQLDNDIKKSLNKVIENMGHDKFEIKKISLPHTEYAVATYYIVNPCEASSNLARYDGIRYGRRDKESENLRQTYINSRVKGLGAEPKRRIMLGTYALSSGYFEAYYLKAQKVRRLIYEDFIKSFEKVDIIITPTVPTVAFKLGEKQEPLSMYLSDIFLSGVSLAGLPALSLPFYGKKKLPYSLQLISPHFTEKKLLNFGNYMEKNYLIKK
ncbi:MAG: Asp-tRNA(Asn)/Glu-tRNA(Gln) amidotransferase subunit GatA [Patescibacteria group bacterium]|nr:Asp-tRNA(Asn)/Glu-tRNA(Gln) amidotransferase subunit GatA [Patescibacteria group bacterium]